jgi:alkylhydroperoxidase family enzyme
VSHIPLVPDGATGDGARLLDADRAGDGYVHNYSRLFARRPAVYDAWAQLGGSIKAGMELRRYELATVAAARQLRSSYCTLAHGRLLSQRFLEPEEVRDLVAHRSTEAIDDLEAAVMDLAEKVAADPTSVTRSDVQRLLDLGATEDDVFDVVPPPPRAASSARSWRRWPSRRTPSSPTGSRRTWWPHSPSAARSPPPSPRLVR